MIDKQFQEAVKVMVEQIIGECKELAPIYDVMPKYIIDEIVKGLEYMSTSVNGEYNRSRRSNP
jgi:hypothetical protein